MTFFLVGIWHGRTSEFIFLGLLFGAGVSINKLWQLGLAQVMGRKGYKALAKNPVYITFGRGLTFSWFALADIWFWADWRQVGEFFAALSLMNWLGVWLAIWLSASAVLAAWEGLRASLLAIKTSEGAGAYQSLCARSLCVSSWPGRSGHDRIAQPACSGYCL